jgi:putative (di)nucleoside polyphosphate hydrolase
VPLDTVIEFKRDVYQQALLELSRFVFKPGRPIGKPLRARPPSALQNPANTVQPMPAAPSSTDS